MQKQIVIIIGLCQSGVFFTQHIVKPVLQDFRQFLSVIRPFIVKYLSSGNVFLFLAVLVNADSERRSYIIDNLTALAHIRHLFSAVSL